MKKIITLHVPTNLLPLKIFYERTVEWSFREVLFPSYPDNFIPEAGMSAIDLELVLLEGAVEEGVDGAEPLLTRARLYHEIDRRFTMLRNDEMECRPHPDNDLDAIRMFSGYAELLEDAENGVAQAQYEIGLLHLLFAETHADIECGEGWMVKAHQQGHSEAASQLGECFAKLHGFCRVCNRRVMESGERVYVCRHFGESKGLEALAWYRKMVERGEGDANDLIAFVRHLISGDLGYQSEDEAFFTLRSDELDYEVMSEGLEMLGDFYAEGNVCPRDFQLALECYRKCQDNESAHRKAARMYREGIGTKVDLDKAKRHERIAEDCRNGDYWR